jgi:hypothetical protein
MGDSHHNWVETKTNTKPKPKQIVKSKQTK